MQRFERLKWMYDNLPREEFSMPNQVKKFMVQTGLTEKTVIDYLKTLESIGLTKRCSDFMFVKCWKTKE